MHRTFGRVRYVWNEALAERARRYKDESTSTSYLDTAKWLTAWKRDEESSFLREVSIVPLQQALRAQQVAFNNFFAKRSRYPRFKSRKKSRKSATFQNNAFTFRDGELKLAKTSESLNIVWHRPLPERAVPSTVTVSHDSAGRWFVSLLVEECISPLPDTSEVVGLDAGLDHLLALSTGDKITNPRHERRDRRKLAKAQKALSRKVKGSNNRDKARRRVAKIHARIADRRRDYLRGKRKSGQHRKKTTMETYGDTTDLEPREKQMADAWPPCRPRPRDGKATGTGAVYSPVPGPASPLHAGQAPRHPDGGRAVITSANGGILPDIGQECC